MDYAEALKWIRRAAEHGEPHAQSNLGVMYSKGLGVSKDDAEAARWTRKAADQGSAEGQFALWFHVRAWQGRSAERDRGCRMVSEGGKPERHSRYEQSRHVARYVERSENPKRERSRIPGRKGRRVGTRTMQVIGTLLPRFTSRPANLRKQPRPSSERSR